MTVSPQDIARVLSEALPEHAVFSPAVQERSLPYLDGTVDVGNGSCVGEHDAAIGLKRSFQAGVCKLNLIIRRIGKDL